jgi:ABC-2 type transport system ATP-binding protein
MTPAVTASGVTKTYANARGGVHALRGIDLVIPQGQFIGLLGPNGAGKTTLIQILAGLVRPTSGHAAIMGFDVQTQAVLARRNLGVVPQELVFDPFFTVRETLQIQSGFFGIQRNDDWIDELLSNLGLLEKANTNMRGLSGGMKRRVLIAQALVHRPPVIVLDEPTAGVDVELRQSLWVFIRRLNAEGHTVLLTTHYLEEAESLCERVVLLRAGQVLADERTQDLLKHPEDSLESVFLTMLRQPARPAPIQ